ncbi:hypothetical protein MJD09_15115 [bacterium]|nr:hypothetical protein [bacterium]
MMINENRKDESEKQIRRLERENKRLQRAAKRYETQLQQLDKMAKANEKININLYNELDVLSKKAEAQAREAQIEAALERVRARAMAMQSSNDLADAIAVVFQEVEKLGISTIRCGIATIDATTKTMQTWIATTTEEGQEAKVSGLLQIEGNPTLEKVFDAWKRDDPFLSYELVGEDLERYYQSISSDLPLPEREVYHQRQVVSLFFFPEGGLYTYTGEDLSAEASQIFEKFTRVFALTYRRYLDLEQAEEQAREAQIEAALERVRARSMAMHNSDELREVVATLFGQIKQLGYTSWQGAIIIYNEDEKSSEYWLSDYEHTRHPVSYHIPYTGHAVLRKKFKEWKRGESFFEIKVTPKVKQGFDRFAFNESEFKNMPKKSIALRKSIKTTIFFSNAYMRYGVLEAAGPAPLPEENADILQRFAKVFEQTYTRFLDLKQAEEQALEAQIEAALERVRARTMAMHDSAELAEVIATTFEQLKSLNFQVDTCAIDLLKEGSNDLHTWVASPQQNYAQEGVIPYFDHRLPNIWIRARKAPKSITTIRLVKKEIHSWYSHILSNTVFGHLMNAARRRAIMNAEAMEVTIVVARQSSLLIGNFSGQAFTELENQTALRFAKVFEQAYTRFTDLQKAEAQAREAQIEAALERVRSRTMGMHHSDELKDVI